MAKALYATSGYPAGSKLGRIKWYKEDLLRASKEESFFNKFMSASGMGAGKGIYVKTMDRLKAGEETRFEWDGYYTKAMVRRPNTLRGTGEATRQFGENLKLARFGKEAQLGDEWDANAIERTIKEIESQARKNLTNYTIRAKDQGFYDLCQMRAVSGGAHGIGLNTINPDDFMDIRNILNTGMGWNTGTTTRRMPITGFNSGNDGVKMNLIVDSHTITKHFKDTVTKTVYLGAGERGASNPMFTQEIRDFGNFRIWEAPSFVGSTNGNLFDAEGYYNYENLTELQSAGMRVYNPTTPTSFVPQAWQDEPGFSWTSANGIVSVGFILGKRSILSANGFGDFRWDSVESQDYGITRDIAVQMSMAAKLSTLEAFNEDYDVPEAGLLNVVPVHFRIK